jgi:hypothetical protein
MLYQHIDSETSHRLVSIPLPKGRGEVLERHWFYNERKLVFKNRKKRAKMLLV